jgi:hypothetical protein
MKVPGRFLKTESPASFLSWLGFGMYIISNSNISYSGGMSVEVL